MTKEIEKSFNKEELDAFLKDRYGYGLWEFEHSLVYIYSLYYEKKEAQVFQFIKKRIEKLESIERKILETIDDLSENLDIYKLYNELKSKKIIKWTPKERKKFIIEKFRLSSFISVIHRLIKGYENHKSYLKESGSSKILDFRVNIKPINLAALVWCNAMKRGKKIDWKNMENLLNWFSKKLDKRDLADLFELEKDLAPGKETLRLTKNKYKETKYFALGRAIFTTFFKLARDEGRMKFPKPLNELDDYIKWEDKSPDEINKNTDIMVLGWFILMDSSDYLDLGSK